MKRMLFVLAAAVVLASPTAGAARPVIQLHPTEVRFGRQPFESFTKQSFEIRNRSSEWLLVTVASIVMPDDFSPGQIESTCTLGDTWLAPHESCNHVVGFRPTPFFAGLETALIRVTAHDAAGTQRFERDVSLHGRAVDLVGDEPVLDVDPLRVRFGAQPFGAHVKESFTITNLSSEGLWVTVEQVAVGDDFSPGQPESTCPLGSAYGPTWLAPGQSCVHVVGFDPSAFFAGRETAEMIVMARDGGGTLLYARIVTLKGTAVEP